MQLTLMGSAFSVVIVEPQQSQSMRQQFQKARYTEFALGLRTEPLNVWGMERDDLDPYSTYLLIIDQEEVLSGCRVIDGERTSLTLDPQLVSPGRSFEISRVLVNSALVPSREERLRRCLTLSLYAGILEYAFRVERYDRLYCDTRVSFCKVLRQLFGDRLEQLAEPRVHRKNGRSLALVPTCIEAGAGQEMLEILEREISSLALPQLRVA